MLSGDLDGLESWLDDADAALEAGARDPDLAATWADTEDLRTAPATISDLPRVVGPGPRRRRRNGASRPARAGAWPAPTTTSCGAARAGSSAWPPGPPGTSSEAIATFSEAVRSLHAAGNLVDELDSTIVLADMWVAAGRPSRARRLYEQALQTASRETVSRTRGPPPTCTSAWPSSTGSSTTSPARRRTWRRRGSWPSEPPSPRTGTGGPWPWRRCAPPAATTRRLTGLLEQAEALYRHGFYPDVRPIEAMKARVQISAGDLDVGSGLGAGTRDSASTTDPDYLHEYEHLTLARLLLAQERAGHASTERTRRTRRPSTRCSAGCTTRPPTPDATAACWRSGCCRPSPTHADGDRDTALGVLGRALAGTPEPEGHVRLFLDEGAPMLELLRDAAEAAGGRG